MALMNKQMKNTCKMIESSFLKVSMSKKRNHEHLVFENFKKYSRHSFHLNHSTVKSAVKNKRVWKFQTLCTDRQAYFKYLTCVIWQGKPLITRQNFNH